jgi:hypothetical protein
MAALETPAPAGGRGPPLWFLGFDAATKTFAFSLSRVDLRAFRSARDRARERAAALREVARRAGVAARAGDLAGAGRLLAEIQPVLGQLEAETASWLVLADGETADLFPGRADESIGTVERLQAVARYVSGRVRGSLAAHVPSGEALQVIIEYQMGPNAAARAVAAALVALFAESDTIIVGPTLKNKIAVCEEGRYYHFAEKYATAYGANKAHAQFNFAQVEKAFGSGIPATRPAKLRGHIADSFMQVLGHLVFGGSDEVARGRF